MNFGLFKAAFVAKLLNDDNHSNDFAEACSEADNIIELEDEVAQWVNELEGDAAAAGSWILNYMF